MFVLAAVFCKVIPIYSAIDINLCPNIDSSIISSGTYSISVYCLQSLSVFPSSIFISIFPYSSINDVDPGSMTMVEVAFKIMAGPSIIIPAFNFSKSNTFV